jgi:hypothetical protein
VQLKDVLEMGVHEGVRRRVEKRAGVVLPLAVGAMIPDIVHKALERAHTTEHTLDRAAYDPMKLAAPLSFALPLAMLGQKAQQGAGAVGGALGGGAMGSLGDIGAAPGRGVAGGLSKLVERKLYGQQFGERQDPFGYASRSALGQFGKEMGTTGANLLRDIANKAMEAAGHAGDASAREAIIGDLKRNDSVLAAADDKTLMEAYHTMTRFAPVLSTDKNAVRSFLRQAVMSGSGPDFMSIKLLADSERAVTGSGGKD